MDEEKKPPQIKKYEEGDEIQIPECCREGHEDCPHVIKKPRKQKTNIGL